MGPIPAHAVWVKQQCEKHKSRQNSFHHVTKLCQGIRRSRSYLRRCRSGTVRLSSLASSYSHTSSQASFLLDCDPTSRVTPLVLIQDSSLTKAHSLGLSTIALACGSLLSFCFSQPPKAIGETAPHVLHERYRTPLREYGPATLHE